MPARPGLMIVASFAFHSVESGDYVLTMGDGETLGSVAIRITGAKPAAFEVTLFGN